MHISKVHISGNILLKTGFSGLFALYLALLKYVPNYRQQTMLTHVCAACT